MRADTPPRTALQDLSEVYVSFPSHPQVSYLVLRHCHWVTNFLQLAPHWALHSASSFSCTLHAANYLIACTPFTNLY